MFSRINLRFPRFTLRTFLFVLFGLIILVLVVEGIYFFQLKRQELTRQESRFGWKPSKILGEELAVDPNKNYVESEKEKTIYDLEASVGVRENVDGKIGVAGYFVERGNDYLTVQVKNENITIKLTPQTGVIETKKEFPTNEGPVIEEAIFEDIERGDWVDVLCKKVGDSLEALSVLYYY